MLFLKHDTLDLDYFRQRTGVRLSTYENIKHKLTKSAWRKLVRRFDIYYYWFIIINIYSIYEYYNISNGYYSTNIISICIDED